MKLSRIESKMFEYWIPYPLPEESRIIIEAKNWKDADKKVRKLLSILRKRRVFLR